MSIENLIQARVAEGRLFHLRPRAPGTTSRRAMLLSEVVWTLFETSHPDPTMEARIGALQADLEAFVEGMALHPRYLFLLFPAREGVWEIRSMRPDPSIRVLGRFADVDVFIATNYALRHELGGWRSRAWRDVKLSARTVWTNLFHTYRPIITTNVHDVVTGAINGKYFKTE
jgi:hypothetical protein